MSPGRAWAPAWVPGLALCVGLAAGSVLLAEQPWFKQTVRFSPLLVVILLGIAVASVVRLPKSLGEGMAVAQKGVLRWGVAGLGLRLSVPEILKIGGPSLLVVAVSTVASLAFGWWLAVRMGLPEKLAILLSVGGSVCGASAVVAADSVVQAEGEHAAVSLGVITLWGTVGIFAFPALGHALGMGDFGYGVFAGATLHEMAQVVAGAQGFSDEAATVATVVKLARITLLAPIVLFLAWWLLRFRGGAGEAKVAPVPWFLVAFVALAAVNSIGPQIGLTPEVRKPLDTFVVLLLCVGMAGVGLKTGVRDLAKAGWLPILAGLGQWGFLCVVAFGLSRLLGLV